MKNLVLFLLTFLFCLKVFGVEQDKIHEKTKEMEAYLDGVIETVMDEKNIAGGVLSVIYDGNVIINKAYGYADIENKIKPDPEKTLFRIASISKMFTWIAAMQLVEQGILDLDADVNEYLEDFKIPETFEQAVTLRSLMSHSAGFEDRILYLFTKDPDEIKGLGELLKDQLPKRVRPPMRHSSYSNHSTGIVQYIIEQKTGMKFEDHVQNVILDPMEMSYTTFRQPIPDNLAHHLSNGYLYDGSALQKMYFEYVPMCGVGGASASAADISKFMKMLLNNTCYNDNCLLDSLTYDMMKMSALTHSPGINPARHGIMDMSFDNIEILGHGGATFWFHSVMAVLPEYDAGFFLAFNSVGGGGTTRDIMNKFVKRYFSCDTVLLPVIKLEDEYLKKFEGKYMTNRRSHTSFFKKRAIENPTLITSKDGKLLMKEPDKPAEWYLPIDSLTFREAESNKLIAFEFDNKGKAKYLFKDHFCFRAFERISGVYNIKLHNTIFYTSMGFLVYVLIVLPFFYFSRKYYSREKTGKRSIPFASLFPAWLYSACIAASYFLIDAASKTGRELVLDIPFSMKAGLILPVIAACFLVIMVWRSIMMWRNKEIALRNNIFYSLTIIISFAALWQLSFWNFIGW